MVSEFGQLFKKHKGKITDKWRLYIDEWDRLLTPYREKAIRLLEIGIQNGGSLEIWSKYFVNAEAIIGCDIDQKCGQLRYDDPRIKVIIGDASSTDCQLMIEQLMPLIDIVIDDGSHKSSDIIRSFSRFFPRVNNGGIYIIEDLHCSYWDEFEGGLNNPLSAISFFKRLTDIINFEHWRNNKTRTSLINEFAQEFSVSFDENDLSSIHSIEFINSLCIISKALPAKNVLGKRMVVGTEDSVASDWKRFDNTEIDDVTAGIKEGANYDVFELIGQTNSMTKIIADHEQSIKTLAEEVLEKDENGRVMRLELSEWAQVTAALHVQISEKEQQAANLLMQLSDKEEKAASLEEQLGDREREVGNLKNELTEQESITQQLQTQLAERENEIIHLKTQFEGRQQKLRELEKQLSKQQRSYKTLQTRLAGQKQELQIVKEAFSRNEAEIKRLTEQHAEREQQVTAIYQQNSRYQLELTSIKDHLNQREAILQNLNATLLEIYSSTAWKIIRQMWKLRLWLVPKDSRREKIIKETLNLISRRKKETNKVSDTNEISQDYGKLKIPPIDEGMISNNINAIFVSYESETPGQTYRIDQFIDSYKILGLKSIWMKPNELYRNLDLIQDINLLIIWRTPLDQEMEEIIKYAKVNNKKIIFDVDDYMFDPNIATPEIIDAIRFNNYDKKSIQQHYSLIRKALDFADFCTCATTPLAESLNRLKKPTFVIPNGYCYEKYDHSVYLNKIYDRDKQKVRIGYAGGTRTHQKDFKIVVKALVKIFKEFPDVILTIFGDAIDLSEFTDLDRFMDRIEIREIVPLKNLQNELIRFDINIAPVEKNIYCEAKSELKYFEAALVKVPTIASPTRPFNKAIRSGNNGFIARNDKEWYQFLKLLIVDKQLRNRLGEKAFLDIQWNYGPEQRTNLIVEMLNNFNLLDSIPINYLETRLKTLHIKNKINNTCKLPEAISIVDHDIIFERSALNPSNIGVVIPLYNYENYIVEALESVKSQTLDVIDLVIVDDCSSDESLNKVINWSSKNSHRFQNCAIIKNSINSKLSATRNVGFNYLQSKWIMPLDPDNLLLPNCLEKCLSIIEDSGAAVVYPSLELFGDEDLLDSNYKNTTMISNDDWDAYKLVKGNYIDAMALVSKAAWACVNGYNQKMIHGWEDYDLWFKFIECGLFGIHIPERLAKYRVHKKSMLRIDTNIDTESRRKEIIDNHPWISIFEDN